METITIKIYKPTHAKLLKGQWKSIPKRKGTVTFIKFCDEVIIAGLKVLPK